MIRPIPLILGGLSLMVAAKIGVSLISGPLQADLPQPPQESVFLAAAQAADPPEPQPTAAGDDITMPPLQCEDTPEEMLRSIKRERDLLIDQREKLAQRAAELDLAAETLNQERAQLAELKGEVESLLEKVRQAQTADVDRLVALYQNMKPKDAANIMNDLDIEVTVMVLGTMDERSAAPILASLNPVRARAVSQIILERSKLPGDQRLSDIKL
ncbi:hypothetical protein ATO6_20430 [Oceanicola sp. 22II-s10i]|uniref:MotE family protein n=1 Tax=Oceanicola sp. 22II-s10i TaxID=1317116 RepID=UPI000B6D5B0B|nr:hypothetical protein [Oceanicola sp. 22II-s10i]OWU83206.1 hypothetical protein ATO6_20430 [Oceanicola sp. 22II-s10i]